MILVNLLREKNRLTEKRENSLWHTLAGTLPPNAWEIANQKEWWFQTENLKYDRDVILRVRSRRTSADSTIQRKHNQQTGTSFFQVTRTHHLKWRSLLNILLNFTPEKVTTKPHQILEVTRKNLVEFDPSIEQKSLMPGSWRQVTQWNFLSCNKRRCRTSPREMTTHFFWRWVGVCLEALTPPKFNSSTLKNGGLEDYMTLLGETVTFQGKTHC